MGNFNKDPKKPFEIRVPNKIRKRIAMHVRDKPELLVSVPKLIDKAKSLLFPKETAPSKRDSMWSRFTKGVANFFNIKPEIRK